jgi:dolichyl-phosphate-mannose--protein O-mannosyl transferase
MGDKPIKIEDPMWLSFAIAACFLGLCSIRLLIPSTPFFDETHYLPAARELLNNGDFLNREHPPLGKQILAWGIHWFGDEPMGWRAMPLIAGTVSLFAATRAMWFASKERFATIAFGILLATGFILFVQTRIAMLDIFMAAFLSVAAWHFTAAVREPETARIRLVICGFALGAAIASKWNAIPLAILPGLVFFVARLSAGRRRLLTSKRGHPIPGISLLEAFLCLGALPLTVYVLSYATLLGLNDNPFGQGGLFTLHAHMLDLQTQTLNSHPYQSNWPDWVFNLRAIWYLYESVEGVQRGILLIGNPVTMLIGLPALIWCLVSGVLQRNWARLGMVLGYAVSLGLWLFAEKSVQFYYHYFVPSIFLLGALALALDALWRNSHRWIAGGTLVVSCLVFAWFYPILSAAPLDGELSFQTWMWLDGWR